MKQNTALFSAIQPSYTYQVVNDTRVDISIYKFVREVVSDDMEIPCTQYEHEVNMFSANPKDITEEMVKNNIDYFMSYDENMEKIKVLKEELEKYDYIGVKIAMGVATKEEYAHEIAYTQELRKRINELELS